MVFKVGSSLTIKKCLKIFAFLTAIVWSQMLWASLKVLMVSAEQSGIFQTGGLAHATAGLAEGLNHEGIQTQVLMPYYLEMNAPAHQVTDQHFSVSLDWRQGHPHKQSHFTLVKSTGPHSPTLFLRHDSGAEGNYFDNRTHGGKKKFYAPEIHSGESFGAFDKAAAEYILNQNYDVVILNDWTTGLIATYLEEAKTHGRKVPKVIFAIHNLAYQGLYPKSLADFLGLPEKYFSIQGYEFWGQMSFLKAGLQFSDMIYTVSPQYATEISTPRSGAGLDGLIREKASQNKVTGILNGISNEEWDPSLPQEGLNWTFTIQDLSGKGKGKADLQAELGLPIHSEVPLFILTSRLAEQKGFEYLVGAVQRAAESLNAQWIIIGDGDEKYIEALKSLQSRFPEKVRYQPFSSRLERKLTRYADFFVNGAWFEPCGLNQLFALKNGTLPVVSAVGGLLNSVKQGQTGILFDVVPGENNSPYQREATEKSAYQAFVKATEIYQNPQAIHRMRVRAMSEDHSWSSRIRKDFRVLFDYVLNNGSEKMPVKDWKVQNVKQIAPLCAKVHAA